MTELKDQTKVTDMSEASGIDNLLYSSDVDFSCFADLAVVSPVDYRKEGEGSLMQVVITPCEKYMPMSNEAIAAEMHKQVQRLFPSARGLSNTWHSVVKIQQSLYRCASTLHFRCIAAPSLVCAQAMNAQRGLRVCTHPRTKSCSVVEQLRRLCAWRCGNIQPAGLPAPPSKH